jgi:D-amino peptidase
LLPDLLDARAQVVLGKPRTLGMMAGLEYGAELVFMIGYHAMSQSRGILAHTINSFAFARVLLNGVETGEAGLYGALAVEYGAQVALLSGDDVFAEETRAQFPDASFVVTKTATGHASGVTQTPESARMEIGRAARSVVERYVAAGTNRNSAHVSAAPVECELRVQTTALADLFCQWPSVTRVDGVTLRFNAASVEHVVRMLNCLSAMSFMLR